MEVYDDIVTVMLGGVASADRKEPNIAERATYSVTKRTKASDHDGEEEREGEEGGE